MERAGVRRSSSAASAGSTHSRRESDGRGAACGRGGLLPLEAVQRMEWSCSTSLFNFIAVLCPAATAEEALLNNHNHNGSAEGGGGGTDSPSCGNNNNNSRADRARSDSSIPMGRVGSARRCTSSFAASVFNRRVLACAPATARIDHAKTLSSFASFVPGALPSPGVNLIVVTGDDGRRRYCFACGLLGGGSAEEEGLVVLLESSFPILSVARAVLSQLLAAPCPRVLDAVLRALPPPVPGLALRLDMRHPISALEATRPAVAPPMVPRLVHSWRLGGGLPEDGSSEDVLGLGLLGPRQLVRVWLALLLEMKVVVASDCSRVLPLVCEVLLSLILPLPWPSAYIPTLPPHQALDPRDLLDAPFPALIGISPRAALPPLDDVMVDSLLLVDLDAGTVSLPSRLAHLSALLDGLAARMSGAMQAVLAHHTLGLAPSGALPPGPASSPMLAAAQRVLWEANTALLTARDQPLPTPIPLPSPRLPSDARPPRLRKGEVPRGSWMDDGPPTPGSSSSSRGGASAPLLVTGWLKLLGTSEDQEGGGGEAGCTTSPSSGTFSGDDVVNLWAELDPYHLLLYPRVAEPHRPAHGQHQDDDEEDEEDEEAGSRRLLSGLPVVRLGLGEIQALTPVAVSEYREQVFELQTCGGVVYRLCALTAKERTAWIKTFESHAARQPAPPTADPQAWLKAQVLSGQSFEVLRSRVTEAATALSEPDHWVTESICRALLHDTSEDGLSGAGALQVLEAITTHIESLRSPGQAPLAGRGLEPLVRALDVLLVQARHDAATSSPSAASSGSGTTTTFLLPVLNSSQPQPGLDLRQVIDQVAMGLGEQEEEERGLLLLADPPALLEAIRTLEAQPAVAERRGPLANVLSLLYEKQHRPLEALVAISREGRPWSLDRPRIRRLFRAYFRQLAARASSSSSSRGGAAVLLEAVGALGSAGGWLGLEGLRFLILGVATAAAAASAVPSHPSHPATTTASIRRTLSRSTSTTTPHVCTSPAPGTPTSLSSSSTSSRMAGFFSRSSTPSSLFGLRRSNTPTPPPPQQLALSHSAPPQPQPHHRSSCPPPPPHHHHHAAGPAYVLLPVDGPSQLLNGRARWSRLPPPLSEGAALELVAGLLDRLTAIIRTYGRPLQGEPDDASSEVVVLLGPAQVSELRSSSAYRKDWSVETGQLQLLDLHKAGLLLPNTSSASSSGRATVAAPPLDGSSDEGRSRRRRRSDQSATDEDDDEEDDEEDDEDEEEEDVEGRRLVFLLNLFNLMCAHAIIEQAAAAGGGGGSSSSSSSSGGGGGQRLGSSSTARLLDLLALQRGARYQLKDFSLTVSLIEHTLLRVSGGLTQVFPVGLGKLLYDSTVDHHDPRRRLGLRQPQPLVNFALCYGTRDSPTLRTYRSAGSVVRDLRENARRYLCSSMRVDLGRKRVVLPELLRFHWQDFGDDLRSFLLAVCQLVDGRAGGATADAVCLVFEKDRTWRWAKVEYTPYDWTPAFTLPSPGSG